MNEKKDARRSHLFSVHSLVMMAVLVAMEIILARYLSVQTVTLRISFETIPLALAGMWLGPLSGVIVALVGDILGTVLSGFGVYFPPLSLGPMAFAFISGLGTKYIFKSSLSAKGDGWKVILITMMAGIINSFVIGIIAIVWYQKLIVGTEGSFLTLAALSFAERLTTKPATIVVCSFLVYLVNKAAYRPVISRYVMRKGTNAN